MIRQSAGFTIIELMVVLTIIGLLLAGGMINLGTTRRVARDAERLGHVLTIAHAIDQSASVNRGRYPKNAHSGQAGKSDQTMCAQEIVDTSNPSSILNPYQIDLSFFANRKIPLDPAPSIKDGVCNDFITGFLHGYTYHTEYSRPSPNNLSNANLAAYQQVVYSLEVGLEGNQAEDSSTFRRPDQLGIETRFPNQMGSLVRTRYIFNGRYCGVDTTTTNCYQQ